MSRHDMVTIVSRWWWVMALVTLVIGSLSLIGWLRTPTLYLATHTVTIAILPAGTPSLQDSYFAQEQTLATARRIVSPGFLTAPAFDLAISHALVSTPDSTLREASPLALGRALSASHASNTITLVAKWGSAAGAKALVTATVNVLASGNPGVLALIGSSEAPSFLVASGNPHTVVDDEVASAARDTLLLRLALAVLAGVLVMGALGLLERGRYETTPGNGEAFRTQKYPPASRRTK